METAIRPVETYYEPSLMAGGYTETQNIAQNTAQLHLVTPSSEESETEIPLDEEDSSYLNNEELFLELESNRSKERELVDKIAENNLDLVKSLAYKYSKSGCDYEDLIGVGNLQLVKCIYNYNVESEGKFTSYLYKSVSQQMQSYIQANATCLSVPIRTMREVNKEQMKIKSSTDVEDTNPYDKLNTVSLDSEAVAEQPTVDLALLEVDNIDFRLWLIEQLKELLAPKEFFVISKLVGLLDNEPAKVVEVAKSLGVTEAAVRKTRNKALTRLREDNTLIKELLSACGRL